MINTNFTIGKTHTDSLNILFNESVKINELNIIKYLLKNYYKMITPIFAIEIAAANGHIDLIKYLVKNNIIIGPRSLEYSIEYGSLEIVKYLISEDVSICSNDIKCSIKLKHFKITSYLIDNSDSSILDLSDINTIIHSENLPNSLIDIIYQHYTYLIDKNIEIQIQTQTQTQTHTDKKLYKKDQAVLDIYINIY